MKNAVSVLLSIFMLFMFPGCDGSVNSGSIPADIPQTSRTEASADKNTSEPDSNPENTTEPTPDTKSDVTADSTLVVYFSCTGNTKAVAEKIAELINADIYEITPSEPYTASDLNYNDDNCRANREMNDESCRPEIEGQGLTCPVMTPCSSDIPSGGAPRRESSTHSWTHTTFPERRSCRSALPEEAACPPLFQ